MSKAARYHRDSHQVAAKELVAEKDLVEPHPEFPSLFKIHTIAVHILCSVETRP